MDAKTKQQREEKAMGDGAKYAIQLIEQLPADPTERECRITSVLIIFWSVMWGAYGKEYARDFIKAQLAGMEKQGDVFTQTKH